VGQGPPFGVEFAEIGIAEEHLTASGVVLGTAAVPYRLDYELETRATFVTARLRVTVARRLAPSALPPRSAER
jgi:hypothetical protein